MFACHVLVLFCTRLSGKVISYLNLEISFTGLRLAHLFCETCRMDCSYPLLFGAPIYVDCLSEDVLIPETDIVYTKSSSIVQVDMGFIEWTHYHSVV